MLTCAIPYDVTGLGGGECLVVGDLPVIGQWARHNPTGISVTREELDGLCHSLPATGGVYATPISVPPLELVASYLIYADVCNYNDDVITGIEGTYQVMLGI